VRGPRFAPVALYFSGLLRLLWGAVIAVGNWVGRIVLSPAVWFGLLLLGVCIVLWVVGSIVARRSAVRKKAAAGSSPKQVGRSGTGTTRTGTSRTGTSVPAKQAPPVDDDFAEIEALLKKRGIE